MMKRCQVLIMVLMMVKLKRWYWFKIENVQFCTRFGPMQLDIYIWRQKISYLQKSRQNSLIC